jgi:hypothetical protein
MTGPVEGVEVAAQGVLVQTGGIDQLGQRRGRVALREHGQDAALGAGGRPAVA